MTSIHRVSHASTGASPLETATWEVRVLNGLEAHCAGVALTHFPSRAVGLLLARLAMWPTRRHAREELIELLWPGVSPNVGRSRFRPVLSALRGLLGRHSSGTATPWVIADNSTVRLRPAAVVCDTVELQRRLREGDLEAAHALGEGVLLPGHYDDWVVEERARLSQLAQALAAPARGPATSAGRPASLPPRLGTLFGRSADLEALAASLRRHRLVTLRGAPGVGKSRLAEEYAHLRSRSETVVFVDLADCATAADISQHLRAALQLSADADEPNLVERFGSGPSLCIVDHAEHLLADGAVGVFRRWLCGLPAMRLLVVSRRAVQWAGAGEQVLAPLPVPSAGCTPAEAAEQPCVALFLERTRSVRIGFWLHAGTLPHVIAICRELQGVPLAIVLASAGARTRSIDDLRGLLTGGASLDDALGLPAASQTAGRHSSLAGAVRASWQLLDGAQRQFAAALAAEPQPIAAGFITRTGGPAACALHDRLAALVSDSLLEVHEQADGQLQFVMPASVRDAVLREVRHGPWVATGKATSLYSAAPRRAA